MAPSSTFRDSAFALIAGIGEFEDPDLAKRPLPQAVNDSRDLRDILCGKLGWDPDHVVQIDGKISLHKIQGALDRLEELTRNTPPALFLFYISTHGHLYENAQKKVDTCLVTSDSDLSRARTVYDTALTPIRIGTYLASIDATFRLIIADACHSATAVQPQDSLPERLSKETGAVVMASSYGLSYAEPGARNSRSTEHLLGLLGRATGSVDLLGVFRELDEAHWLMHAQNLAPRVLIGVAGLELKPAPLTGAQILQFTLWKLQESLDTASGRPLREGRYVTRADLEREFIEFLTGIQPTIFTISGGAGSGKTTSTLRLAEIAANHKFPTLWIAGAEISTSGGIRAAIEKRFRMLRADVPLEKIFSAEGVDLPVCIIIDAINEWEASAEAFRAGLTELMSLARENLRIVVSCRDTHWELVRPVLQQQEPSARLTAFDDEEAATARRLFGFLRTLNAPELARQPLFLRIAAETFEQIDQSLDSSVTVASILASYLELKFARAALLVTEPRETIAAKTREVIRAMLDRKIESLPVRTFLDLAKENIGLALLDCGLFRRIGSTVSVEAQTIHEYLVAQDPDVDPFEWIYESGRPAEEYQPLRGAALFRLAEMNSNEAVLAIFERLAAQRSLLPIFALPRLQNLSYFRDFFVRYIDNRHLSALAVERLLFVLERSGPGDFEFCMAMAKPMFLNENYYFWERKRWRDLSTAEFRAKLDGRIAEGPGHFLIRMFNTNPEAALTGLYQDWLKDNSGLEGGSLATISGVAITFICAFSKWDPELGGRLFEDHAESIPSYAASEVVREMTDAAPNIMLALAKRWIQSREPKLRLAMNIIAQRRSSYSEMVKIVDPLIRKPDLNEDDRYTLVRTLGGFASPESFQYLSDLSADPMFSAMVVKVLKLFPPADPDDALRIIWQIRERIRQDPAIDHAVAEFYAGQQTLEPAESVSYLRDYLVRWPDREMELIEDLKRQEPNPELECFIDERVRATAHPELYEDYCDYIRRYRRLDGGDVEWLLRWADSDLSVFELILYLADSEISFEDSYSILQRLEKNDRDYRQHVAQMLKEPQQEISLRQFAERVQNRSETAGFAELNRVWLNAIASGAGSRAADEAVQEHMFGRRH
jgi:hypothetical protein